MANSNEGPPIRLSPRRSKRNPNDDPRRYAGVVGSVLRFAQMTNRARRRYSQSQSEAVRQFRSSRLGSQRVSVRVTYAKNKNQGQWKAHGHYVARDTATQGGDPSRAGFDATRTDLNIASVLDSWQRAGDERLFKLIVSPEFGERLNLQDHTRKLIQCMQKDLKTPLEWVAAVHFNTEHPHVHIALRGKDQNGCSAGNTARLHSFRHPVPRREPGDEGSWRPNRTRRGGSSTKGDHASSLHFAGPDDRASE